MEFELATSESGGYTVISVKGELDVYTAPLLEECLNDVVSDGTYNIVVDLTETTFMDSTGLGLLIKALKWSREHDGSLRVVASAEKILKVFRVTGLDTIISLHQTVAEATGA